jgi:hypothetical protein
MRRWLLSALVLLTMPSCSVPVVLELFNGFGRAVVVVVRGEDMPLERLSSVEFADSTFEVRGGACALRYQVREIPPPTFVGARGWKRHVLLQLEPDERVFVLEARTRPPAKVGTAPQPSGFPLTPRRECADARV